MTTTSLLSAAFQAAAITPIKQALAADTMAISLSIQSVMGAAGPADSPNPPKLYWATSAASYAAVDAPSILGGCAKSMRIPTVTDANATRELQTDFEMAHGSYVYVWSDLPALSAAITLGITLVEAKN